MWRPWARLFAAHEEDAAATLASQGTDLTHAGDLVVSGNPLLEPEPPGSRGPAEAEPGVALADSLATRWGASRDVAETDAADLAAIRRAAARDAINAIALAEVVSALAARGIPIRCPIIDDGVPQQFTWRAAQRRFLPGAARGARGPQLVLLGPSQALVRKHWHRLPVGGYLTRAAGMADPDPWDHAQQPAELRPPVRLRRAGHPGLR